MDDEFLRKARNGDRDAFASLCEPHRGRVWKTVYAVTRRAADAEDLAQDVFLKAFQSLPRYRGDIALFGAWLTRIAINTAHDWRRSAWTRKVQFWRDDPPDAPDLGSSADLRAELLEQQRQIRAAVARLGEKERVPIHLIYFEEYSLADVARLEGVPESTIRSRVKAGLKRLSGTLADWESDDSPLSRNPTERGLVG